MKKLMAIIGPLLVVALLVSVSCARAPSEAEEEVVKIIKESAPEAPAWDEAREEAYGKVGAEPSPPPPVVIANRISPSVPIRGVRNMLIVVPVPKSKMRCQAPPVFEKSTHIVKVELVKDSMTEPMGNST